MKSEEVLSLLEFLLLRHVSSLALNLIFKKRNIKYHRITHLPPTFFFLNQLPLSPSNFQNYVLKAYYEQNYQARGLEL